ncbi:MAG: carboxylating nicotinate-nucleotide diphosphorylase [Nitrospiraceae bacterium]|nr:MAG: carboxylating nicotinate-nucleotide diphosphorylase [Nitrospiraceae bacterium]
MLQIRSSVFFSTVDVIIRNALKEDIGSGDITTSATIPRGHVSTGTFISKGRCTVAGLPFVKRTFFQVDRDVKCEMKCRDGVTVKKGYILAEVTGSTRSILKAERVALNILQRLCGIATLTGSFVGRVKGINVKILDTRKTAPGLRYLDKYAVKMGGGHNHRFGLYDAILIKDNHIDAAGGIENAVRLAGKVKRKGMKIEVETNTINEVRHALNAEADIVMLDNMPLERMKRAVNLIRKHSSSTIIEASGNIDMENVRDVAATGVDWISVGALTHSAPAADISLKIKPD